MITLQRLKELLDYDSLTGVFCWKVGKGTKKAGSIAGYIRNDGYRWLMIDYVPYSAHRLAWFLVHEVWPKKELDHRNGIRDDNSLENLREATRGQNQHNAKARKKHGLKGAHFERSTNRWKALITHNRVNSFLGRFDTEAEAHEAYVTAAQKLHGEFARAA